MLEVDVFELFDKNDVCLNWNFMFILFGDNEIFVSCEGMLMIYGDEDGCFYFFDVWF